MARYGGDLIPLIRHAATVVLGLIDQITYRVGRLYWGLRLQSIGSGSRIYSTVRIYRGSRVRLGSRVVLNDMVHIWGAGGLTVGDDTLVASHVAITTQTHDVDALSHGLLYRETSVARPINIGRNVWIGTGAIILPGITIGDGAIVAAGSVITRDVAEGTLVAGVPAKFVRRLANSQS
jgi:maltose O-acetyltransferase